MKTQRKSVLRVSAIVSMILAMVALFWGAAPCAAQVGPVPTIDYTKPYYTQSPILRKFVDSLPGLGPTNANGLGQYIPVATPDTKTYANCDYYEIWAVEYTERMHSDLPAPGTKLRGYVQMNLGTDAGGNNTVAPAPVHYLGPLIIAQRDRPVRIKFVNKLSTGSAGKLFIPMDNTYMGAGTGPLAPGNMELYTENRACIHLHGGNTPWISDGTPHQWVTPSGETTSYKQGVGVQPVPDMPLPVLGDGTATIYYTNAQSARLMFYHDHAYGITRLNVYAGLAAGYLLQDPVEKGLVTAGVIPADQIPLIIQDKIFVPDAAKLAATDPLWDTTKWGGTGNLWFPHVYVPNQDPTSPDGANPFGRWDYGPWFWPIFPAADPLPEISGVPEAFMDTPIVNGTAYPFTVVQPKAYRLRILNACNDRYLNLQFYYVDPANPTEVKMVPAVPNAVPPLPARWPTDSRDGGVPDPTLAGPDMIVIGTEGGLLRSPAVIPPTPIGYEYNRRNIVVLNVLNHGLFLGPAERADVIVDFSAVPPGSKLILYNDAPAPVPAFDPRNDYYTGDPDQTSSGGAPTTLAGFGPNTRTIMQFRVQGAVGAGANLAALQAQLPVAFAASQPPLIVPEVANGAAANNYAAIFDTSMTFTPNGSTTPITYPLQPKTIQELFDTHGRMNATLGVELPFTTAFIQTTLPFGYIDPPTEIFPNGQTQIWKITHNGVDTHAIHFHLFNVQVINRVGWDGAVRPPDPEELGWKETVKMSPLEDIIVAMKATVPTVPFAIPDSVRSPDVTSPPTSTMGFANIDPTTGNPITPPLTNAPVNYGHEYVWHCHLLGHEENDMMRAIVMLVPTAAPNAPTIGAATGGNAQAIVNFTPAAAGQVAASFTATSTPGNFTATGVQSPITVLGLTNGTSYQFSVTATNSFGTSVASALSNAVVPAPVVPTAPLSVTAVPGNTQAFVSFLPPASNGGSAITLYTATSNPGGFTGTGASSPVTVGNLVNGTAYTFSVTARNVVGTGPASVVSNVVVPTALPGPPTIGTATAGVGQATILFTPPVSAGASAISSYTATASPGGLFATGAGSPLTIQGLTPGSSYTISVTATNGSGTGPASAASNAVVIPMLLTTAPSPISPGGMQQPTPNPPPFTWSALNTAATYDIDVWNDMVYSSTGTTWTRPTGFTPNATNWWRVRGVNALGAGPYSAWASFTVPPIPIGTVNLIGPLGTLPTQPNPPQFSWTVATNATGYNIELWNIGTYTSAGVTWTPAAPLLSGQTIWWRVQGTNGLSTGAWTAWQTIFITPLAIGAANPIGPINAQPNSPNPPAFTWSAATNAVAYDLDIWLDKTYSVAGTTWTAAGPYATGQVVWWRVRGKNGGDVGAYSAWASFTVTPLVIGAANPIGPTGTLPNAPNPPAFTWTAATNAAAYDVDVYLDKTYSVVGTTWTAAGPFTTGQVVWWRVRGKNGGDIGAYSAWASFTVTPVPIGASNPIGPTGTLPNAPNPPAFTWSAATGANAYDVDVYLDKTYTVAGATTWTSATPFITGQVVWWRVRGRNNGDVGAYSAWASFTITPVPIGAANPIAPQGAQGAGVANPPAFTWSAATGANAYDVDVYLDKTYTVAGATTWTAAAPFATKQVIWWRVRGRNIGDVGAYSAWASFTLP
ncbi:MAG: fibronectin type III domain-containing protein [Planctomycetota bacterium]|nr:fibronectin type III domain-containing protein [Planctomycetota bacterium]